MKFFIHFSYAINVGFLMIKNQSFSLIHLLVYNAIHVYKMLLKLTAQNPGFYERMQYNGPVPLIRDPSLQIPPPLQRRTTFLC